MSLRRVPSTDCTAADPSDKPDSFAEARANLASRPLRSARLRQIAAIREPRLVQEALRDHLARHPGDPDALYLAAQAAGRLGRGQEAASLLARCCDEAPDFAAARFHLANLLIQLHRYDAALAEAERLVAEDARNPLFRHLKANILGAIGEDARSLVLLEELAREDPREAEFWLGYGHALRASGFAEKSIAAYRKVLELHPSSGLAYWSLAHVKTFRFAESDLAAMQAQLGRAEIPADDRAALQFALAKAYEDTKSYEKSFALYAKANAAMRLRGDYDLAGVAARVAANKALFTPEFVLRVRGAGCPTPDPIFVLGLPRSGTTLVEQILASHSAIEGLDELPYIGALAGRLANGARDELAGLAKLEPAALGGLGEEYLEHARLHRKLDKPFFVDKKPRNFLHAGLIHLILPKARIIDVRRHPVACCLSAFKSYFPGARPRLAELGQFYRLYLALMAHFDRVLPGRMHRVIYERLVTEPDSEIRGLLDYVNLPFEDSCLRFHETERAVRTPSAEQVRRPLYTEGLDSWRHFEPWLGPLIDSLGSALTRYPDVPKELL